MPKDRDQLTPEDPSDRRLLQTQRGQGTGGTGLDLLPSEEDAPTSWLEVTSEAFDDGDPLPDRFAHRDANVLPPIEWSAPPDSAVEIAIVCEDPDAPEGTFTHWLLAGIDPTVTGLAEGETQVAAVTGINDFGERGWGGPEPPPGDAPHRYVFTVIAVDEPLELGDDFSAEDLRSALAGRPRAAGQLIGRYGR